MLGLVLCGAGSAPAQATVEDLVARLGSDDGRRRHDAYLELQRSKPVKALPLLVERLPTFPLAGQSLGILVVANYPPEPSGKALRRLLASSSPFLVASAGAHLLRRGDRSAIPAVVEAVRNAGSDAALNQILGQVRSVREPQVLQAVLSHLKPTAATQVVESVLRHALDLQDRSAVAVVSRLLSDPAKLALETRGVAAAFQVAMGEQGYDEILAGAIREMPNFSRLRDFLNRAPKLARSVLAAILESIEGKRGHQVGYALQVLARHDYGPAVRKMRELLDSDDAQVSKAAFDGLMQMGTGLEPKHLRTLLQSPKPQVVVAAADALRRLDDHAGIDRLIELSRKPGGERGEAVEALGKFRVRRVVPVLFELMDDPDRNIRQRAEAGVNRILRGLFPDWRFDAAAAGYRATDPAAARRAALGKLRGWWTARSGRK